MVSLTQKNDNAVSTTTFAFIVVEQVTKLPIAKNPPPPKPKPAPPKFKFRTRTARKKPKQPSDFRTD